MRKVAVLEDVVRNIPDGASIMMGGFGTCGVPENLIRALLTQPASALTIISNNAGVDDFGVGLLVRAGRVQKLIATYVGENKECERQIVGRKLEVELVPQGTFSERIRAGGAGIAGFYTPTGHGTVVAEGKETRDFSGRPHLLELGLRADYAFVKAWRGDDVGNLVYRRTARNFNPMMAAAGHVTIAEVEQLVERGSLDPDTVATPGIYVQYVVQGAAYERRVEKRTVRDG
jgi:3-oxoacid CoA-transferase A subunit